MTPTAKFTTQWVEEEATIPLLTGLKEVVEHKGVFCALYSDRARHFWLTAKAGEAVDQDRLTQVGRALRELLRHLARPIAAGTALAWDPNGGGGECLPAPALHRRV
jgi:hypothetical protein